MHLILLSFAVGFLQHPRNQKSLAAKARALRGIAEAETSTGLHGLPWVPVNHHVSLSTSNTSPAHP